MENILVKPEGVDGAVSTLAPIHRLVGARIDVSSVWVRSQGVALKLLVAAVVILNAILIVLIAQP
jgi:hypothetical protein